MRKMLIFVVLAVLCFSVGIYFFNMFSQKKQENSQDGKISTQIELDREEILNILNGEKDIADRLANVKVDDAFQALREDWLNRVGGDADIAEALKHVNNIDYKRITTKDVEKAIQCGDLETLKKIRESGFNRWDNRQFVLKAANTPFADIMKFLAENGADLDVTNDEGISVIYLAANGGNVETAKFLAGWIGDFRDTPIDKFPYLKDAVKSLSFVGVRNMMSVAIIKKMKAGENIDSEKTRKALYHEFSKSITMERKSLPPDGYVKFQKAVRVEAGDKLELKKKQDEIAAAAEKLFPLYRILDQVRVGRRGGIRGIIYISGRLEKVTPKYIVVSQQTIHTMDMPEHEQSKFIPEVNSHYRREYMTDAMEKFEKKVKIYLRKRWERHLRTARMNGYFYDEENENFVHALDIFDAELRKLR